MPGGGGGGLADTAKVPSEEAAGADHGDDFVDDGDGIHEEFDDVV